MAVLFMNLRRVDLNNTNLKDMIDYYSRDEAVNTEALEPENVEDMLAYYGRFDAEEMTTGFDFNGDKTTMQAKKELDMYQPSQVYQTVISFRPEDAERLNITNKKDFSLLCSSYVMEAAKVLKIRQENLVWTGFMHSNTENPHCHLYFFDKSRIEQPLLTRKQLNEVRSKLGNRIMNQVDNYKMKDDLRKTLIRDMKMTLHQKNFDKLISSRMVLGHGIKKLSDQDKKLLKSLRKLAQEIPHKGRKQSATLEKYYPDAYKTLVSVREQLIEGTPFYEEYKGHIEEMTENFKTLYGSDSKAQNYEDNQMKRLHTLLNNAIIQFVTEHRGTLNHPEFDFTMPSEPVLTSLWNLQNLCFNHMVSAIHQMRVPGALRKDKDKEREDEYDEEY